MKTNIHFLITSRTWRPIYIFWSHLVHEEQYTFFDHISCMKSNIHFLITSRWTLLRMRNILDERCRENYKTQFRFNNFFPPRKSCLLCENVVNCWRVCQATWQYGACALHDDYLRQGYRHKLRIVLIAFYSIKSFWFRKRIYCHTHTHTHTLRNCLQRLIYHYDFFSQIVRLRKATSKRTLF